MEFFTKKTLKFGGRTRKIVLPDSNDQSHSGHTIQVINKANSDLIVKTNTGKGWKIAAKDTTSFRYDGSKWTRKEVAVACPKEEEDSCSSSEDDCKRGPRGPPGRDGCPGENGLNGLNGKNGKCTCQCSQSFHIPYSGTATTYLTTLQAPCWAKAAIVTAVGGGGAGGAASIGGGGGGNNRRIGAGAGQGGGSGFSIMEVIPTSGGFLALSIGQGGQATGIVNGTPTVVTYTGALPYAVYAPGGHGIGPIEAPNGQYGGGAGDGVVPYPPGTGFEDGDPAVPGVKGGDGGGYLPGIGGASLVVPVLTYGAGGGGSAPGPVVGAGGNGGGNGLLNGTSGTYGSGGGGAGILFLTAPPALGVAGNGGDGYVNVTFIC